MKKYFFAFVYFLLAIIVFIFARIDQETLDIAVHDNYWVIQYEHIWKLLSLYFFVLSLITFVLKFFNKKQNKVWLHLHIWSSLIIFLGIIFTFNQSIIETTPKRYYDYSVYEDFKNSYNPIDFNEILTVLLILFVFVQLFFIISILVGYFQQRKHGQSTKRDTKHVE
jgi:cytochrome c oxidase subunit 1